MNVQHVMEQVQSLEHNLKHVADAEVEGQVVTTQQSFFGTMQNITTCPECNGTGKVIKDKCTTCHGTGYTSSLKKIAVTIPAGIDDGQSVRIQRKR